MWPMFFFAVLKLWKSNGDNLSSFKLAMFAIFVCAVYGTECSLNSEELWVWLHFSVVKTTCHLPWAYGLLTKSQGCLASVMTLRLQVCLCT